MKKKIRFIFALLVLVASSNITKAQTTCDSAVVLTPSVACNYYVQQVTPGSTGIYFYKITVNNELVKTDKIVVIK